MHIGAQQQAVVEAVFATGWEGQDVRGLQDRADLGPGDRATAVIRVLYYRLEGTLTEPLGHQPWVAVDGAGAVPRLGKIDRRGVRAQDSGHAVGLREQVPRLGQSQLGEAAVEP